MSLIRFDARDLDLLESETLGCMMGGAAEDAIASGNRDENALTDLEFSARHPERKLFADPKIQPGEKDLAKEWIAIRDDVVRPALVKSRPAGAPLAPAPAVPGSNAAVAETVAATNKRNQMIGIGLGGVALVGILVAAFKS